MISSLQCAPEKSEIFLAVGHSPYHSRYIQTSPCKHVRSVYSRLALLIAYAHYIITLPVFTILFAKSKGNRIKTAISFGIGACLFAGFNYLSNLESMSTGSALIHALCSGIGPVVAGIIILFCYNGKKSNHAGKASKWFFYIYYPAHLLFLWAVHQLCML